MAEKVKERWPEVDVQVVDEEEVKLPPKEKKEVKPAISGKNKTGKAKLKPKHQEHKNVPEDEALLMSKRRRTNSDHNDDVGGVML